MSFKTVRKRRDTVSVDYLGGATYLVGDPNRPKYSYTVYARWRENDYLQLRCSCNVEGLCVHKVAAARMIIAEKLGRHPSFWRTEEEARRQRYPVIQIRLQRGTLWAALRPVLRRK